MSHERTRNVCNGRGATTSARCHGTTFSRRGPTSHGSSTVTLSWSRSSQGWLTPGRCPGANGERAVPRGQWRAGGAPGFKEGPARTVASPVRAPPIFPPVVRHLYVHIPFCVRRCSYCDFSIAVRKRVPGSEYVHAVLRELDLLRDFPGWVNPGAQPRGPEATGTHLPAPRGPEATDLETVYLGGGTPSLL